MKKKLIITTCCALLCCALFACGAKAPDYNLSTDNSTTTESTPSDGKEETTPITNGGNYSVGDDYE